MQVIPAIDIKEGKCVRLYQGQFEKITEYDLGPVEMAKSFIQAGANYLHLVDLDGAKSGKIQQFSLIEKICQIPALGVQVGGGVRSLNDLKQLFSIGVAKVVIGSLAVIDPRLVMAWIKEFGNEKIVLALDVCVDKKAHPLIMTHGWQKENQQSLWELLTYYQQAALKYVLCTDISCDGTLNGPNLSLYQHCCERFPDMAFQASGGIGKLTDMDDLKKLGLFGVVVGKALYEKKFTLQSALQQVDVC